MKKVEDYIYEHYIKDYPKVSYRDRVRFINQSYSKFFAKYMLKNNILNLYNLENFLNKLSDYSTRGKNMIQDYIFSIGYDTVSDIISYLYGCDIIQRDVYDDFKISLQEIEE